MKNIYNFIGIILLLIPFSSVDLLAQPATTGCHLTHSKIKAPPLTEKQKVAMRASVERSDTIDILHYDIELDVTQFAQSFLHGKCTITFRTKMDNIDEINLDLLDMIIGGIESSGNDLNYSRNGFNVKVQWPEMIALGDTNSLTISYRGRPTVSAGSFGGFYFEGGYAYNLGIDLIGQPHNFGRSWFPCFDNFVERATYSISMISHQGRKGYAVGNFIGEEQIGGDTIRRSYEMQKLLPTYLVGVAVANYAEDNFVHQGAYGDIPVQIVAKPGDMTDARNSLAFLPDAIDCLEFWYGPYVWNRVGYVMTLRGAMEHAGNIAYPDNSVNGGVLSTRLMTHELCHHWWGNIITVNYAPDMWIKEGNAEYGAHLIEEYIGGKEPFRKTVRNNHHFVMTTAHLEDGDYLALSPLSQENTYGRHTYYRGASMMHNMRAYLGDSLFRSGQQDVLNTNAYSFLNAQAYRDALTTETGVDMTDFFNDWIFSPGYTDYYFHHADYAGPIDQLSIVIGQNQFHSDHLHNNAPVPVTLFFEDGSKMHTRVNISGALDSATIGPVPSEPIGITVNTGQIMNLGMFEDAHRVMETGEYKDARANYRLNVDEFNDTFDIVVENHLTAPGGIYDEIQFRLSNKHFWHVVGNHDDDFTGRLFLFYDDNDELAPDDDLTSVSEDSIVVMYRPDAAHEWTEYPDYIKVKILPTDGKGNMILSVVRNGDYTFANRLTDNVAIYEIQSNIKVDVFPNPASSEIHLVTEEINFNRLQIYSLDGQLITEIHNPQSKEHIITSSFAPGEYIAIFSGIKDNSSAYTYAQFAIK